MTRLRISTSTKYGVLRFLLATGLLYYVFIHMNELDAIQQQMAALGIDVSSPTQEAPMYDETAWLTPEDEAMFAPGGELAVEETIEEVPTEGELEMPAYDIEELKIDIQPMLQWLPKEEFANLIIWMAEQFNLLNSEDNA